MLAHQAFTYCPDDAFITYRYSRNLIEGYGAVFNPGASERVEGFSCPLFMLIAAVLMKLPLGIEMIFRAKFFGIVCGLLTLRVVQKLCQQLELPHWVLCAAPIVVAAHPSLSISCIDGMETVFGALLATSPRSGRFAPFRPNPPTPVRRFTQACFSRVALLHAPEGLLMGLFSLVALLVFRRGKVGRDGLRFALSFLAPVVVYFLFRRVYYWPLVTKYLLCEGRTARRRPDQRVALSPANVFSHDQRKPHHGGGRVFLVATGDFWWGWRPHQAVSCTRLALDIAGSGDFRDSLRWGLDGRLAIYGGRYAYRDGAGTDRIS